MTKASGPRIAIHYCTQCHWLLRAAWMAQELLSTFGTDLGEVSLQPGTGGVFVITYDGEVIWERKADGDFPDVKQLKQRVRDHLDPDRDLGHLDRLPIDQCDHEVFIEELLEDVEISFALHFFGIPADDSLGFPGNTVGHCPLRSPDHAPRAGRDRCGGLRYV